MKFMIKEGDCIEKDIKDIKRKIQRKYWTDEEKKYLIDNCQIKTINEISEVLNRSEQAIRIKIKDLGLNTILSLGKPTDKSIKLEIGSTYKFKKKNDKEKKDEIKIKYFNLKVIGVYDDYYLLQGNKYKSTYRKICEEVLEVVKKI